MFLASWQESNFAVALSQTLFYRFGRFNYLGICLKVRNMPQSLKITKIFADNLTRYRKREKFTMAELAGKIGVDKQAIWYWENERKWPGTDNITKISEALNIAEADLFKDPYENVHPSKEEILSEFGRLLSLSSPEQIRFALDLLQPDEDEVSESHKNTSNT
jgi:transcriptional regulator with XRE-family HTH domain